MYLPFVIVTVKLCIDGIKFCCYALWRHHGDVSHHNNMNCPIYCFMFWKGGDLEVYKIGIKI